MLAPGRPALWEAFAHLSPRKSRSLNYVDPSLLRPVRPVCHRKSAQSALVSRSYTRSTKKCTLGGEVFNMCSNFELFTKKERVTSGNFDH